MQGWSVLAGALLVLGGWRTVTATDPVRQLIGLNVMAAAASLILITAVPAADPALLPAARTMAVGSILVAFGVTAFGLRVGARIRASTPSSPDDRDGARRRDGEDGAE